MREKVFITGGERGIGRGIALDLAPYGIRINNVAPGAVRIRTKEELADMTFGADTDYFFNEEFLDKSKPIESDFWDELGKKIPLGRAALPEDICIPLLRQSILHHWRHPAGGWRTYTARHA